MKRADRMMPSTVPSTTNCTMRFTGALSGPATRRGSYSPPSLSGTSSFVRFATVLGMATSPSAGLAPIRTKFALSCAFAALITLCTLATAAGARSAGPPVARAVFVTPAGDRAAAQRAVVAAGGVPRGLGGRKAQGGARTRAPSQGVRRSPAIAGAALAETSSAGRDRHAGRRPERRRRAAAARAATAAA